jgi:phosphoribosylanthranilate isomerase
MRVKVCGMTQVQQIEHLPSMGVSFAGFIFYPKSPRFVLRHLTTDNIRKQNNINKVGVFVNASVEHVLQMVDECRLHMVQLHGDETPKYCEKIADYISVVKAFRISDNDNIEWMIRPYREVCDFFLFDTEGAGYGGTGKKFNWELLNDTAIGKPFFLSGGIHPDDADKLRTFSEDAVAKDLFAIDINSKFEVTPGVKDLEKVQEFVTELKHTV